MLPPESEPTTSTSSNAGQFIQAKVSNFISKNFLFQLKANYTIARLACLSAIFSLFLLRGPVFKSFVTSLTLYLMVGPIDLYDISFYFHCNGNTDHSTAISVDVLYFHSIVRCVT